MPDQKQPKQRRSRQTRRGVVWAEKLARALITIGGIGTIFAVSLIMLFLAWVVVPLFSGASTGDEQKLEARTEPTPIVAFGCDDYQLIAWTLARDGVLALHRLDDGSLIAKRPLVEGQPPTAISVDDEQHSVALGFADGTVRLGRLGATSRFLELDETPDALLSLKPGEVAPLGESIAQRTPEGQVRIEGVEAELGDPVETGGAAVVLVDQTETGSGREVCTLDSAGVLRLVRIAESENMISGEVTRKVTSSELPTASFAGRGEPMALLIGSGGSAVFVVWRDGTLVRFDTRYIEDTRVAEEVDLLPEPGVELTAVRFLLGRSTLIAGDSSGRLSAWFCTKPDGAPTSDGALLREAHELKSGGSAVTALAISLRTRTVVAGYGDGSVRTYNVTSAKELAELETKAGVPIAAVAIAPKEDGLLALSSAGLWRWSVDLKHPEANLSALFLPVWYEGYPEPEHVWQSSSGTDDFEPKYGLMPLIFGTLKATLYSMLFGVPLALLAAVFSSEFLSPRVRVPVKSLVEIMASLPSVVLGFLAAIIIAPFVQNVVPQTLVSFVTIPVMLLFGARLWQLLPQKLVLRWEGWQRLVCVALAIPAGIALAALLGPFVERTLFAGDIFAWLSGEKGSGVGGWMFMFLPLAAFLTAFLMGRFVMPWLRAVSRVWSRSQCAWADVARFLVGVVFAVSVALALSWMLAAVGFDARGSYVDTYVQRNALVVGFVMGFAIIPIIYTIAEDALSSVPSHLRLASLGAGATAWQTAMRVIIPTAMSGLFSAVMIGLGRAVGETMIVLMATGNTPVMNWNIFAGFRTLSANIATELPEAVRNSTHYRTLFLAALVLFAMTFALNTVAEVIRQRFRRRAYQL